MSLPTTFFIGRGGISAPEWAELQTGDTYQGGTVLIADNKVMLQYYPASRKTTGLVSFTSNLTGTFTIPEKVTTIDVWAVGGGAGGTGGNYHGGGGGGGSRISGLSVTEGHVWNYQVGRGGNGGIGQSANDSNYIGDSTDDFGENGGNTNFTNNMGATNFTMYADGGTRGNVGTSNSTNVNDFGQGGVGSFSGLTNVTYTGSAYTGTGGRGGGRDYGPTNASSLGGGGGGGQPTTNWVSRATGGHGAGRWGGGGGAGNPHDDPTTWSAGRFPGGSPGNANYAYSGGYGGQTSGAGGGSFGQYGQDGGGPAGGRAYQRADGSTLSLGGQLGNGSAGGGGFPGGGGGGSVYSGAVYDHGYGGDGASGILVIEWPVWA